MDSSRTLIASCRIAGIVLVLATILLWAPQPEVEGFRTGRYVDTGRHFCDSFTERTFGLLGYYSVSRVGEVERATANGSRLVATVLLTAVTCGGVAGLWMLARRVRKKRSA